MKSFRIFALVLVLMMFQSMSLASAPDMTLLDSIEGITYTYDDMEDQLSIKLEMPITELMAGTGSVLCPDILSLTYDNQDYYIFRLDMVSIDADACVDFKSVIIKVGETRYNFDVSASVINEDPYMEEALFPLTDDGIAMIEDILSTTEEVKVRFVGDTKSQDFVLTDPQREALQIIYNCYTTVGGLDQDLTFLDSFYPITVK